MDISVIGLGKLGSPLVSVLASKGYRVVAADVDERAVALVDAGRAPVVEPGLSELLAEHAERISATTDTRAAVAATEVTFVVVPTPSDETGGFSLRYLLAAFEEIGEALATKSGYHVVAVTSTVLPGATERELLPVLEQRSGKRSGVDFGICYNPEFIALGSVIRDMLAPDMILIGESDRRAGDVLQGIYETTCENEPVIARMNFANAELTKIAINTYVTTKISYANMLGEICERLPGGDVDVVTAAVGADSRIGTKYLRGGMPYGGPCFPRDNVAFAALARSLGVEATIAEATDAINHRQVARIADLVEGRLDGDGRVAVLGLSYKPNTPVVEEAAGVALVRLLLDRGIDVVAYDPVAADTARPLLAGATFARSGREAVAGADAVVITTPWDEFGRLEPDAFARDDGGRTLIVDGWRVIDHTAVEGLADYVALGIAPASDDLVGATGTAVDPHRG